MSEFNHDYEPWAIPFSLAAIHPAEVTSLFISR
jgi:hypothetical protein